MATRTRKRRSETRSPVVLLVAGLLVMAAVGAFIYAGLTASSGLPGISYRKVYAELPDVGNLKAHDEVRMAGTRVGQVIKTTTAGRVSRVQLQLDGGVGRLPADTTAAIRARGLLGTRYLELRPGRSLQLLPGGGTVHAARLAITNGVPDVLDTFDRETRHGLSRTVDGLGRSFAGRGQDIGTIFAKAAPLGRDLDRVARAVLARGDAARVLLPSVASGATALDGARDDIAATFRPAADGLQPFVDERAASRQFLDAAPSALAATNTGLRAGERVLAATQRLSRAVNTTLPDAPPALQKTTALLRASRPALARTTSLLRSTRAAVPDVLRITRALKPRLEPLQRLFDTALPIIHGLDVHGCEVRDFADNWRSALGQGTASHNTLDGLDLGPLNEFRIQLISGPEVLTSLAPSPGFKDTQIVIPPCRDAPGGTWSPVGLAAGPRKGGG